MTSSTHGPAASYCDVTMAHCSHGYLWTHDVEVGASWRDCEALSYLAHDFITLHILVEWFITQWPNNLYTFWVNLFVSFNYHFRTPVFQHGTSLVYIIVEKVQTQVICTTIVSWIIPIARQSVNHKKILWVIHKQQKNYIENHKNTPQSIKKTCYNIKFTYKYHFTSSV